MAVGQSSGKCSKNLDDVPSAIDKRRYGRSRKRRVTPEAATPDDPASTHPAAATATASTKALLPQPLPFPAAVTAADAVGASSFPQSSLAGYRFSPSSFRSSATSHTTNRSSPRRLPSGSVSQQSDASALNGPRREEPESYPEKGRHRHLRHHGGHGRWQGGSDNSGSSSSDRSLHRDRRRRKDHSYYRGSRSKRRSPYHSSSGHGRSKHIAGTPQASAMDNDNSSYTSSSGNTSYRSSTTDTTSGSSAEAGRREGHNNHRVGRSYPFKRRSNGKERSRDGNHCRSYRSKKSRSSSHHRDDRDDERRYSSDRRNVDKHRDHRGTRRGNSSSHHRRDKRDRKRSPESGEGIVARDDQARRKNRRPRRKYQSGGGHGNHRRSRAGSGGTYPRQRSKTGRGSGGGARKSVTIEQAKRRVVELSATVSQEGGGEGGAGKTTDALETRGDLRQVKVDAVVNVQRLVRGFLARQRVAGRREALAFLRNACFGVVMDLIDAYIRKDIAPVLVAGALAEGFEGGESAAALRAEAAEAANGILAETTSALLSELVTLAVMEEADSHLDIVFFRNRRNPLLVTVDDIIAMTLRVPMKEVVVEVVREIAEDFISGRRISAFVEDIIEDGVMEMVGPVATDVYYTAVAQAVLKEVERELVQSVVVEAIAPFEGQLVELQRERDIAAIQATAHNVIVKGLQLQHAARTVGQKGRLVIMSDINRKTLNLFLAGRFLAILRAAETNRLQVSTSPLLFILFRRLVIRTGRRMLLEELSRELDRDEKMLHALELERIDEADRQQRNGRGRAAS